MRSRSEAATKVWAANATDAITPKVFASCSPGFIPWDLEVFAFIVPKALANTFGVLALATPRFPSVVASLQRWAEIRERPPA